MKPAILNFYRKSAWVILAWIMFMCSLGFLVFGATQSWRETFIDIGAVSFITGTAALGIYFLRKVGEE